MPKTTKPILNTLREIRQGKLLNEAADELAILVRAIKDTKKGGSLIITIKVEPLKGDTERVLISGKATTKLPVKEKKSEFMYTTDDDNLSANNPRQPELALHAVKTGDDAEEPVIQFDEDTGEIHQAQ